MLKQHHEVGGYSGFVREDKTISRELLMLLKALGISLHSEILC